MLTEPSHAPAPVRTGCVAGPNRRQWERSTVTEDQAWIGWWEERLYRKSPAALLDISQGGVRLASEFAPPCRSTAWVCLSGQRKTEWVEGTVLEVRRHPTGTFEVRLAFREICPYAFFEVAVYGFPTMIGAGSPG